jgi:hypothetical protein
MAISPINMSVCICLHLFLFLLFKKISLNECTYILLINSINFIGGCYGNFMSNWVTFTVYYDQIYLVLTSSSLLFGSAPFSINNSTIWVSASTLYKYICIYVCIFNLQGKTPLHVAVANADTQIVELLIEKGADPNNCYPAVTQYSLLQVCCTSTCHKGWLLNRCYTVFHVCVQVCCTSTCYQWSLLISCYLVFLVSRSAQLYTSISVYMYVFLIYREEPHST